MTIVCSLPDGDMGVALRLSDFLRCQAQALGENGFQALAGGPLILGMLSALVTLFVALIGYRFLLGRVPDMADGIGWVVRLGIVLTLATGWPAFQTLIYRVAVETPQELARIVLPASGLLADGLDMRVQQAYDAIRLGSTTTTARAQPAADAAAGRPSADAASADAQQPTPSYGPFGQAALPQTASWFVVSTLGVTGALRLAMGFLLAIGPLAIMALLFDATTGLFVGWIRALGGAALALLAGTIVTVLDVLLVESELAHLQSIERGVSVVDPQALTTIVLAFTLAMLAAIWAAAKTAGGFKLSFARPYPATVDTVPQQIGDARAFASSQPVRSDPQGVGTTAPPARAQGVADALAGAVRREQNFTVVDGQRGGSARRLSPAMRDNGDAALPQTALGPAGRRAIGRRARSASRRDGAI